MTTLKTNAIEPEGATTNLTVGLSGQNVVIGGSGGLKANTMKDAGGNTLFTSNGSGTLSSVSGFGGAQVLISSQTASNSSSISFTSGLTSTYKEYVFEFFNINPATDNSHFRFDCSVSGTFGTINKTTTWFNAFQTEANTGTGFSYDTGWDLAQSTAGQYLMANIGSGTDESGAGELHLFNPSSTTYVKHFYARTQVYEKSNLAFDTFPAGYLNTTSAIDGIKFEMNSGTFDGTIKMYGIK